MVLQRCRLGVLVSRWCWLGALSAGLVNTGWAEVASPAQDRVSDKSQSQLVRFFAAGESITYAENVSIDAWMNDLKTQDVEPGEYALTRNYSEIGFAIGQMSLAGFARREYLLRFSQDTFDLVYRDKNDLPIDSGRNYAIDLEVSHVLAKGLKVGYDIQPFWGVKSRIEFNVFEAEEVLFGGLKGYLGSTNGRINGDLLLDYNYTEDVILDRPVTPPAFGRGRSIDLEFWWQPVEQFSTHILMEDLYSSINWSHTPYTQATITTVRTYTDSSGNNKRMPTISGREYFREITQRIPRHTRLDATYKLSEDWDIELAQERIDSLAFNRLTTTYNVWSSIELGVGYDFTAKAPRLELRSPYLNLMVSTDTIDSEKTKFVNLSGELRIAF